MTPTYLFADALVSPLLFAAWIGCGLLLAWRGRRRGWWIAGSGVVALALACLPAIGNALLTTLEPPPLAPGAAASAQAIVILSAGPNLGAPEWGGETVDHITLARVRYGAQLARETGLPVLVTGGRLGRGKQGLGDLMAAVLEREFQVPVRWVENEALTTAENARLSAPLLRAGGVQRVLLVTSAVHMRRSLGAFAAMGLDPIAAPTDYLGCAERSWQDLVPSLDGMRRAQFAIREWLGNLMYALRT
jgi:uncharacterized SAM-binding protein YcdF (DUF218 family)